MGEDLEHWRTGLAEFDSANELIMLATFAGIGKPASLLDVGCGTGAMVRAAQALHVDAVGVDQLVTLEYGPGFVHHDLRNKLDLERVFGMVVSIEVAEHLPESVADNFCNVLAHHVCPNGILVFTAAMPGQAGWDHVNCQPREYWAHKLYLTGLRENLQLCYKLALAWWLTPTQLQYLAANLQVWQMPG